MKQKLWQSILVILLLFAIIPSSVYAAFPDVPSSHPNNDAINFVQEQGIVKGYPDGTFGPGRIINRAEFTKIMVEAELPGQADGFSCRDFPDVKDSDWFSPYVCFARAKNIIKGYPDGTFKPANPITFVEMAKIIVATAQASDATIDLPATDPWYQAYTLVLEQLRAIPTTVNAFDQKVTRGEVAEVMYRIIAGVTTKDSRTYAELNASSTAGSSSGSASLSSITPFDQKGFAGIYAGVESKLQFQPNYSQPGGGSYVNRLIQYNWVFLSNGKMYNSLPSDGNVQGYCDTNTCGSYSVSGNQISVTFPDGTSNTYSLNNGGIKLNGNITLFKAGGAGSLTLNGTWHRSNYVVTGSTGIGSEQQITFRSDGTFSTTNFSGFTTDGPYAGGYGSLNGEASGTYKIANYAIDLVYDSGFSARHTFFQYGGEDTINFDGKSFIK